MKTIAELLNHCVEDTEYIVHYHNVIMVLDMLGMEYTRDSINELTPTEMREASQKLTQIHELIRYTLGR